MVEQLKNCFLINAPAGSGKTTTIRSMVNNLLSENQKDCILCITYTNRAADELLKSIKSDRVFIGTIHTFLHSFIKQYFMHQEMLDLYFKIFRNEIQNRITNPSSTQLVGNQKYIDKYGSLSEENIKKNIKQLSYNESPFSSLYYGGLSHDDLIRFSYEAFSSYPKLQKRLINEYQTIFIDEYQDTSSQVLKLFYFSVKGKKNKLYLFGDKMQQIYRNYDGSFETEFTQFDDSQELENNYRSTPVIIDLLNRIYNDSSFLQKSAKSLKNKNDHKLPQAIICNDIQKSLQIFEKQRSDFLVLRLFNRDRFEAIGAGNLYDNFSRMEKYKFYNTYNAIDVLTTNYKDNPDPFIKLFFFIEQICNEYTLKQYGVIIQEMKKEVGLISPQMSEIISHQDKSKFKEKIEQLTSLFNDNGKTIEDVLTYLNTKEILQKKYYESLIQMDEYKSILCIPIKEIANIATYLRNPKISTQHGVKGESHNSVIFVAEDSKRIPIVHMYNFFNIWTKVDLSLNSLEKLYYSYIQDLDEINEKLGFKIDELNSDNFSDHEQYLINKAKKIMETYSEDPIFKLVYVDSYNSFLGKPGLTKAKSCFKDTNIYGILSAYKLFYVGCSRARHSLIILINRQNIIGSETNLIEKFKFLGFEVTQESEI